MDKIDLKRQLKHLYQPSAKAIAEVDVPAFNFLMIDGAGNPNTSQDYRDAVETLFSVAYSIKFALKKGGRMDYAVMPLEGLWWADDMAAFQRDEKQQWLWTMMIMQPQGVCAQDVESAITTLQKKSLASLSKLRFETFHEGRCAQLLHVGPFADEGPAIERLHAFIGERSALRGKHHEIYLSDIRRAAPEKWKTIIRQPMQ